VGNPHATPEIVYFFEMSSEESYLVDRYKDYAHLLERHQFLGGLHFFFILIRVYLCSSVVPSFSPQPHLTHPLTDRYTIFMAHSYLIFDFGTDEEAAQQARHKLESWKQGFRLGNKLLLKFEREGSGDADTGTDGAAKASAGEVKSPVGKKKSSTKEKQEKSEPGGNVRLLIRLDFSDHEKLSHQRWLDRIPSEEPFRSVEAETVRHNDPAFTKTAELFESLD
jgi:hypothetical protein